MDDVMMKVVEESDAVEGHDIGLLRDGGIDTAAIDPGLGIIRLQGIGFFE